MREKVIHTMKLDKETGSQKWDSAAGCIALVPSMAGQMPQEHI